MSHGRFTPASSASTVVVVARCNQLRFGAEPPPPERTESSDDAGREPIGVKVPLSEALSLSS